MSDWFAGGAEWNECNPEEIPETKEEQMKEIYFEITQWPYGQSLDVANNNDYSITIAGVHGGGVGKTIKRFKVNIETLKDAIAEICREENE